MKRLDIYLARDAGKKRYPQPDPEGDRTTQWHRRMLEALEQALQQQQFLLYYPPRVNLENGRLTGLEAGIRWQHP